MDAIYLLMLGRSVCGYPRPRVGGSARLERRHDHDVLGSQRRLRCCCLSTFYLRLLRAERDSDGRRYNVRRDAGGLPSPLSCCALSHSAVTSPMSCKAGPISPCVPAAGPKVPLYRLCGVDSAEEMSWMQ